LKEKIRSYNDLRVYQAAMDAAMRIFELTKAFPAEEKYSMADQMRRCSRSVCTNIGEAWRKRRYAAHFISKLSDSARVRLALWLHIIVGTRRTRRHLRQNSWSTGEDD
jgi:23S rRNA-intervening sequence protein